MDLQSVRRFFFGSPSVRDVVRGRLTMIPPERLRRLTQAAEQSLRVQKGDVLEFGVALGGSAVLLANKAKEHQCRFAGFDVFDMHPAPSDNDDEAAKARYEVIAAGKAEGIGGDLYYGYRPDLYEQVCDTLDRNGVGVDGQNIMLVKGYFEDTWPSFFRGSVAFAHIDVSWHDPVLYGLEAVAPLLTPSGRIVVNTFSDARGSRKAVERFLGSHPDFVLEDGVTPILRRAWN